MCVGDGVWCVFACELSVHMCVCVMRVWGCVWGRGGVCCVFGCVCVWRVCLCEHVHMLG